jgi:glutathione S-transferase
MAYFDRILRTETFVAGADFSMADITVFAGLLFADAAGLALPSDLIALTAWRSRIADRRSVKTRSGQAFLAEDARRLGF